MKQATLLTAFVLGVLPVMSGCGIGKTGVLFVTKTNMGFEVSTQPPTAELTISRVEGVVGPQFENAKKPPVMASFKFENTGIFAPHVGSAFATGDAAVTMAGLYGDETYGQDWQSRANELKPDKASTTPTNSVLELDKQPEPGRWLPLPDWGWLNWLNPKLEFQTNDVRPVFFGTDTAFGVKVAWSGMTGQYPDTAKIGYNRKELALVPVSMKGPDQNKTTPFKMKIPSLLATLDSGVKTGGAASLDTTYIQYFATGNAATLLALQKDVRYAMLARIDPHAKDHAKEFAAYRAAVAAQETEATRILRCYLGVKVENLPDVWAHADAQGLFREAGQLTEMKTLHGRAMADPAARDQNLRRANQWYASDIAILEGSQYASFRLAKMAEHRMKVCEIARK